MATIIMERLLVVIKVLVVSCSICCTFTYAADTIVQGQTLMDWDLLDSPNGDFRLQFFTPEGTSKNRYLGIQLMRYGRQRSIFYMVVWVANRDIPVAADASGRLMVDSTGNLRVANGTGGDIIVLYNAQEATNASAALLDSGNFVLRKINPDGSTGKVLWQSFDYPTDVLLPGMKLGINYRTGHESSLVSWASEDAPATGSFTLGVDANHTSQLVIRWRGEIFWTSGPWLNGSFENAPRLYNGDERLTYTYISNQDEKYFMFSATEKGSFPIYRMHGWGLVMERENSAPFATCAYETSPGCVKVELPECRSKDDEWFYDRNGDMSGDGLKFPNSFTKYDCKQECLKNCSCVAYAPTSDDGTGCEIWSQATQFVSYDGTSPRTISLLHKNKGSGSNLLFISGSPGCVDQVN